MKRLFLVMMSAVMSIGAVSAQLTVAPEVGMRSFRPTWGENENWYSGVKAGVAVEYKFRRTSSFSLKSGLYYIHEGRAIGDGFYISTEHDVIDYWKGRSVNHSLHIPIMAQFGFQLTEKVKWSFAFGPIIGLSLANSGYVKYYQFNYGLWEGSEYPFNGYIGAEGQYYDEWGFIHRSPAQKNDSGLGMALETTVEYGRLRMQLGYDMSLGDNGGGSGSGIKAEYHAFNLTIGYAFTFGK